jgi:hypothetical protein
VAPLVLALNSSHGKYYWRCVASGAFRRSGETLAAPMGKTGRICSANNKFFLFFYIRCASPIGGVQVTEPIVLAQHKENKRIGEARTPIRSASPIVIEIA